MNILDEDIGQSQGQSLATQKIHFRKIGVGIGRFGMKDREDILPLLHQLKFPTFFTGSRLLSSHISAPTVLFGLS